MSDTPTSAATLAGNGGSNSQEPVPHGEVHLQTEELSSASEQQLLSPDGSQQHGPRQSAFSSQFDTTSPPAPGRPNPYNMTPMTNALPQAAYRPMQYSHGAQPNYGMNHGTSPAMMPQVPHYGSPTNMSLPNHAYYVQQPHMNQYYGTQMSQTSGHGNMSSRQGMPFYPNQPMMNHPQSGYYYTQSIQYPGQPPQIPSNAIHGQFMSGNAAINDPRELLPSPDAPTFPIQASRQDYDEERRQNAVRGPPRKPKQSGHAIWIGNLPPQTDLMSLVRHVCKETPGLESLFLISKSNCAFANFKDESTCILAQQKLHDSKFQSVRLVSRLRKSTVEGAAGVTAPTGPASVGSNIGPQNETNQINDATESGTSGSAVTQSPSSRASGGGAIPRQDKFFILKSLTVEDLEHSAKTGIWATQSHNEDSLNHAFKNADGVYLVFSANKSGEYFGYARMTSEINEDPDAAIEFAPKSQPSTDGDLPKAIPTDETEFAPKGRIIDDSARGTIFWEADRGDSENGSESESDAQSNKSEGGDEDVKTWGKPFKLEWLSTTRLPFYRTRGLRNPWNSNREVKIARDGTELEPSVGRRLIGLFNRIQSPGLVPAGARDPMGMGQAFPSTRPYGQ